MTKVFPISLVMASMALAVPGVSVAKDRHEGNPPRKHRMTMRHLPAKESKGIHRMVEAGDVTARKADKKRVGSPERLLGNGVELYGWLGYSEENVPEGLYEFSPSGYSLRWEDPEQPFMGEGWEVNTSWLSEDGSKVCGYSTDNYNGYQYGGAYVEMDFISGKQVVKTEYDISVGPVFNVAALNYADGYIYGFGFDPSGNPVWARANSSTPTVFETVRGFQSGDPLLCSMAYCQADGMMYGVTSNGKFVSFDSEFKMTELIASLEVPGFKSFITGLCYSDKDNMFYWNVNAANPNNPEAYKSFIYAIDVAKKTAEPVMEFYSSEEFMALYAPVTKVADDMPMTPEYVSNGFSNGSLSGSVTFKMPASTGDGNAIKTEMDWKAVIDGVEAATGKASASDLVEIPFTNLAQGNHQFGFAVTLNGNESKSAIVRFYVGNDVPLAPANVQVKADGVSWDAVTEGVNGGFVDLKAVSYEVKINGKSMGTFTTNSAAIAVVDPAATYSAYRATVEAIFDGMHSEPGRSGKLLAGKPFELDMDIRPTAEQADLCVVIDGNNDGSSWVLYDEVDDSFFNSQFSSDGDADDYLILPALNFPDKDAYYEISLQGRARRISQFPEEYIDVRVGRTPEASSMTKVIMEKTQCTDGFSKMNNLFKVPESGTWYVAIRCCSGFDQYGVYVKNIKVSRSQTTDESPVAVSDISCTPASPGALKAAVSFTLPTVRMNGASIPAGTNLTATVIGKNTATVSGAPGERVSAEVETNQGDNTISVYVSEGSFVGPVVEASVYTGVTSPGLARNVKASVQEDNTTVVLTWEPPLEGENGGYIEPDKVSYEIYIYGAGGWIREASLGANELSYTYSAYDLDDAMAILQLGVQCVNKVGANPKVSIGAAIVGKPYDLPLEETFDRTDGNGICGPTYGPSMMLSLGEAYTAEWGYSRISEMTPAWSGIPGGALVCDPKGKVSKGRIALPKVATNVGKNEAVKFDLRIYTGDDCADLTKIFVDSYGLDAPVLLGEVRHTSDEWSNVELYLPSNLTNRTWVQPILDVNFSNPGQLFILDKFTLFAADGSSVDAIGFDVNDVNVYGLQGEIVIAGAEGRDAAVYTASGNCIAVTDKARVAVAPGIYIVKVGGKATKVVVR